MGNEDTLSGNQPDMSADLAQTTSQIREGVNKELDSARANLNNAKDAATAKASSLADEAKTIAAEKTAAAQKSIAGSLQSFGEALRAAGDQLSNKDQAQAASLVNNAAGGIDSLAGSLKDKPLQDVVGEVRKFGQANPTALIAGSVLAGLALGRFLKSSSPTASQSSNRPIRREPVSRPSARRVNDPFRGDETLSGFPENSQTTSSSASARPGATSSSAFGSQSEPVGRDTARSTPSTSAGQGDAQ